MDELMQSLQDLITTAMTSLDNAKLGVREGMWLDAARSLEDAKTDIEHVTQQLYDMANDELDAQDANIWMEDGEPLVVIPDDDGDLPL